MSDEVFVFVGSVLEKTYVHIRICADVKEARKSQEEVARAMVGKGKRKSLHIYPKWSGVWNYY